MSPIARAFRNQEGAIKRMPRRFLSRGDDVDEIAQETFLRSFAAEANGAIASPEAFLFTTARNLALNEKQRKAHRLTMSLEDFSSPDVLGSDQQPLEDEKLYGRQMLTVFAEAVAALPEQCRSVFLLRKVHGLSQREVAQRLGISESTVEKQVAGGLRRTSEFLRRRGYDVPQGSSARPRTDPPARKAKGGA